MGAAEPLQLITTAELDQADISQVVTELVELARQGRLTKLVLCAEIDGDHYITERPGCSGMDALALHEFAKSAVIQEAWGE